MVEGWGTAAGISSEPSVRDFAQRGAPGRSGTEYWCETRAMPIVEVGTDDGPIRA